jgi:hypothetical protein
MRTIKTIQNKKNYTDCLTSAFRNLGEATIGTLDTALSFMYLFRRFGMPSYTNKDDYKILYDYRFKYKELYVFIHASSHEHVYFNVLVPKKYTEPFFEGRREYYRRIAKESLAKGICNMPFAVLSWSDDGLTSEQKEINSEIMDREAKVFFSPEDYKLLTSKQTETESKISFHKMLRPFTDMLHEKFKNNLSPEDAKILFNNRISFEDVPEMKEQSISFFEDMKRGVCVRDVYFNLIGYESSTNQIKKHIK